MMKKKFSSSYYASKHEVLSLLLLLFLAILTTTPYRVAAQSGTPNSDDPYNNNYRVTPSMAVIVVVLIAALFFMVFFSLYIRRCSESSSTIHVTGTNITGRSRRTAARGLDATIINTFPSFVYSDVKAHKIGKGALECAVCLSEFEDNETLRLIPKCDHVFHIDCIDVWLASHTTCPVCRANLSNQPGDPVTEPEVSDSDIESQNEVVVGQESGDNNVNAAAEEVEVTSVGQSQTLSRSHTRRGSGSVRPYKFPRSHTTGHSLVQPGENTERFTLKLPDEVRKEIVNRTLDRAISNRGKEFNLKELDELNRGAKSDRWVLSRNRSILARASSFLTRVSSSVRSPRVAADDGEGTSSQPAVNNSTERGRPPV